MVLFNSFLSQLKQKFKVLAAESKEEKLIDLCHQREKKKTASKERHSAVLDCPTQTPQGEINRRDIYLHYHIYCASTKERKAGM